jgi:2-haloacid dehalogenase
MTSDALAGVKALTFDVFGTVTNWRSSVIAEGERLGAAKGFETDWGSFVDDWRFDGYMGGMRRVRDGELPPMTVDQLHRRKLDQLLEERAIEGLSEAEVDHFNRIWHRLDPWPDSAAGLDRLRSKFIVSTLSNGNVALLVNMAKHGGLHWDCVLSAELTGAFKPEPQCYERAVEILGLEPRQVMMVAAHQGDLKAAMGVGLRAAFIPRPDELGPDRQSDLTPDPAFDVVADGFLDLADKLGC